jgi:hypothetical protein
MTNGHNEPGDEAAWRPTTDPDRRKVTAEDFVWQTMTGDQQDPRAAYERRLAAARAVSAEEPPEAAIFLGGAPVATAPRPAPPTDGAPLLGRRFVFDGSDGINGTLTFDGPERLSRLLLFVKWFLCLPLLFWLGIYRAAALVVAFVAFLAILITGRYPPGLFNFARGYVASHYRVYSYSPLLLSDEWTAGQRHPLDFQMAPAERQSRLLLVFVKLPMMVLGAFFGIATVGTWILTLLAFPMWFAILFTGRYPHPARRFAMSVLQWSARVTAWQFFMSDDWALFGRTMKVRVPALVLAVVGPAFMMWYVFLAPKADFTLDSFGVTDAKHTLEEFMVAGRERDLAKARSLTDARTVTPAQFDALMNRRDLFDGYRTLSVTTFRREKSNILGDRIRLEGQVGYAGGSKGAYQAILIKREGSWYIQLFLLTH